MLQYNIVYFTVTIAIIFLTLGFLLSLFVCRYIYLRKGEYSSRAKRLNKYIKPFGFAYDLEADIFYSINDPWQRDFGYCQLFDDTALSFNMVIDCEPIIFTYGGRQWRIEFWKGQYGMTTGAEIGIYYNSEKNQEISEKLTGTIYQSASDEERLQMAFSLYKNGDLLFTREGLHWWLTGFKLGEYSEPSELAMHISIIFPNTEMLNAFVDGMVNVGYCSKELEIDNLTLGVKFKIPKNQNHHNLNAAYSGLVQENNRRFCHIYQYLTKDYEHTLDKIDHIFDLILPGKHL